MYEDPYLTHEGFYLINSYMYITNGLEVYVNNRVEPPSGIVTECIGITPIHEEASTGDGMLGKALHSADQLYKAKVPAWYFFFIP